MATPSVGDVLVGKYRVDRVLGEGGMGIVFAATNTLLDQAVAIKVLKSDVLEDATVRKRFEREARAAAKLESDHVARVLDVGQLADGEPYLVLEFLNGEDMSAVLVKNGRLSTTDAVDVVLEACDAVAEAHALGIVHRDLKPANLFRARLVDGTTRVKVLDFGIAKKVVSSGSTSSTTGHGLTGSTQLLGSPLYMAPEQLAGGAPIDARTDVWAFGVILFEFLSGTSPFDAGSIPQVFAAILERAIPPLPSKRPDVPAELDRIVARCLSRDPKNRFESASELARALAPWGSAKSRRAAERAMRFSKVDHSTDERETMKPSFRPPGDASIAHDRTRAMEPASPSASGSSAASTNTGVTADVRRPPSRAWIYALLAAVGLGGAVGVWFITRGPGEERRHAGSAHAAGDGSDTVAQARASAKSERSARPGVDARPSVEASQPAPSASVAPGPSSAPTTSAVVRVVPSGITSAVPSVLPPVVGTGKPIVPKPSTAPSIKPPTYDSPD